MDDFQVLTRTVLPKEFIFCFVVTAIHHSTSHLKNIFILQNLKSTISTFSINDNSFNVFFLQDKKLFFRLIGKYFSTPVSMILQKEGKIDKKYFIKTWPVYELYFLVQFFYTYQVKNMNIIFKRKNSDISEKLQ